MAMTEMRPPAESRRALRIVAGALAGALALAPEILPSAWAAENLIVPDGPAAGGKWDPIRTPYLVEIINHTALTSPTNRIVVRKSGQVGFTLVVIATVGYIIDVAPQRAMLVMPTVPSAQDFNREKLAPAIDATPALSAKVSKQISRSAAGSTILNKRFPGGSIILTGANSASDLRSKTVKFALADEIDEWPLDLDKQGDPMGMLNARQISFDKTGDWKRLEGSTPLIKGASRVDEGFESGDQRFYQIPCPHCGEYQKLHFFPDAEGKGGLRFNKTFPFGAYYSCRHCGAEIAEHHKTEIVARGKWVAEKPEPGRHPSYHIDSLISLLVTWDRVAKEFLDAKDDPVKLKTFWNLWLGLAWEERGEAPEWQRLFARREEYAERTVPPGALLITLAVDVQDDGLYYEVLGWGEAKRTWVVDAGFLSGDTADPDGAVWKTLTALAEREYPTARGGRLKADLTGVDAGHNSTAVWAWVRARPGALALRGVPGWYAPPIGTPERKDVTQSGKKKRRGMRVWPVGTWPLKAELYAHLRKPGLREGAAEDPPGYCRFGAFLDQKYFQQLTAESLQERTHRGRVVREWHAHGENHFHDCRIYNMALADRLGVSRLTSDGWAQLAQRDMPPSARQGDLIDRPPSTAAGAPTAPAGAPASPPQSDPADSTDNPAAAKIVKRLA